MTYIGMITITMNTMMKWLIRILLILSYLMILIVIFVQVIAHFHMDNRDIRKLM